MKTREKIILFIGILLAILLIPNVVNAAYKDTFTTPSGITAKKVVNGTDGGMEILFTNIEFDTNNNYTWCISKTSDPTNVYYGGILTGFSATNKTVTIPLATNVSSIKNLFKETNNAYISIKNETTNQYVVEALNIDLTLPAMKAFRVNKSTESKYAYTLSTDGDTAVTQPATYGIKNIYYKFEQITDTNILEKYNKAIADNTDLSTLTCFATVDQVTDSGWTLGEGNNNTISGKDTKTGILEKDMPTKKGVYYMWLKGMDDGIKTIYGYSIISIDTDALAVTKITVENSDKESYRAPETVKLHVYFNKTITGTVVPTLKIRFGESPIRELTNGLIKNESSTNSSHYIEYTYNVQESDYGYLKSVELIGGDIKDENGKLAKLLCPEIKERIKAKGTKGPEVEEIAVAQKNNEIKKIYKTSEEITIDVLFDENIIGTIVPTLKIRFGNSPIRELTNGVIENTIDIQGNMYIRYRYTIQDSDIGQLAIVDLIGGNITNKTGLEAILTNRGLDSKTIIEANVNEGNNNNGDNNQGNNEGNEGGNGDGTTMGSKLPQTGDSMFTIIAIIATVGIGVIFFFKSRKYREIK